MCSNALCSSYFATASLTQIAYTTLSEHTYSLVANNLTQFIMKQTIYEEHISDCIFSASDDDYDYIDSWFDENPNYLSEYYKQLRDQEIL